jgi:hypothetical protein
VATNLDSETAGANEFIAIAWGVTPPASPIGVLFAPSNVMASIKAAIASQPELGFYKAASAQTSAGDVIYVAICMTMPTAVGLSYASLLAPLQGLSLSFLGGQEAILFNADYADPSDDVQVDANEIAASVPSLATAAGGMVGTVAGTVLAAGAQAVTAALQQASAAAGITPTGWTTIALVGTAVLVGVLWVYKEV